jgi:uncharacterized protein YjiS (DUF1127 family)
MSAHSVPSPTNVLQHARVGGPPGKRLMGIIREWRRRVVSRRELAGLTDRDLRDIGYPADGEAEKHKPFWRR